LLPGSCLAGSRFDSLCPRPILLPTPPSPRRTRRPFRSLYLRARYKQTSHSPFGYAFRRVRSLFPSKGVMSSLSKENTVLPMTAVRSTFNLTLSLNRASFRLLILQISSQSPFLFFALWSSYALFRDGPSSIPPSPLRFSFYFILNPHPNLLSSGIPTFFPSRLSPPRRCCYRPRRRWNRPHVCLLSPPIERAVLFDHSSSLREITPPRG